MKIAQLFILVLAFLIIKPASAGLLIEPVVGYNFGKVESDSSEKFTGSSVGGRIGYQNLGFQLGLDYLKSSLKLDDNDYKENVSLDEFAGFVGYEFPILLRVYAGYIFSANGTSKLKADLGSGAQEYNLKMKDGTGTKLGVGFTVLPFLDINFEYRNGKFDKTTLGGFETEDKTKYQSFMIGVSLPFVI